MSRLFHTRHQHLIRDLLLALVVLLVGLWHFVGAIDSREIEANELWWIGRGIALEQLTSPSEERWRADPRVTDQPPLASYLIGLSLRITGHDLDEAAQFYGIDRQAFANDAGMRSEVSTLLAPEIDAARWVSAIAGSLAAVVIFFAVRALSGTIGGVIAALAVIFHPLMTAASSTAGSDALLALLIAMTVLAAITLADRPQWAWAVLLGIVLGLGGAVKLSPLYAAVLLAGYGLYLVVAFWPGWVEEPATVSGETSERRNRFRFGSMLLIQPLVAFLTFIVVTPTVWDNPLRQTLDLTFTRLEAMDALSQTPPSEPIGGDTTVITSVPDGIWRGVYWLADGHSLSASLIGVPWLDFLIGLLGVVLLALLAIATGPRSRATMTTITLLAIGTITLIGMRADIDRYHLPYVLVVTIGLGTLTGALATIVTPGLQPRFGTLAARRAPSSRSSANAALVTQPDTGMSAVRATPVPAGTGTRRASESDA